MRAITLGVVSEGWQGLNAHPVTFKMRSFAVHSFTQRKTCGVGMDWSAALFSVLHPSPEMAFAHLAALGLTLSVNVPGKVWKCDLGRFDVQK